jgi:aryl-alcohol dehydrogenase-like predicted oxidoreductase
LKQLPREKIQISTKFGVQRTGFSNMQVNGSPEYVRSCCDASLKRLDVQYIDLYYQHRVDTKVPIEETVSDLVLSTTWLQRVISCLQFEIIKFSAN